MCPSNCTTCSFESTCNSAMYMDGCHFFPPNAKRKKKTHLLLKFFGKFFR